MKVIFDMESELRENAKSLKKKLKQETGHLTKPKDASSPLLKIPNLREKNAKKELAKQRGSSLVIAMMK